ncbi:MAG: Camelysin metallo-endopeptidase [Eubacteriales bacterium]|nr:Camelysin metallo-endopeptidase [Eubacteriales bacterium]
MKISEKIMGIILALTLFASASGATSAFLTSRPQSLENTVTMGSVKIRLEEPAWKQEAALGLEAGASVHKDPYVVNTGKNSAWIFLKVLVPVRTIRLVEASSGRKTEAKKTELFSFNSGEEWQMLEKTETSETVQYVYGYRQLVKPGQKTSPLFEYVKLANYLEGELSGEILALPVEAAAVQDGICGENAGVKEIYAALEQQNNTGEDDLPSRQGSGGDSEGGRVQ